MNSRQLVTLGVALLALVAGAVLIARAYPTPREAMIPRHLENAHFAPPPAAPPAGQFVANLWSDLWGDAGEGFWRAMVPNQAGVLWIALAVMLVLVSIGFIFLNRSRQTESSSSS